MKRILSALLLILASGTFSAYAQNSISLVGFGEIPYVKNSNDFTVTFKEYGSFDFMGTVQPLSLETTVRIDQLKKIPGYKILKELELVDATLKLSPDGFELEAKADTKKKLKTLCDALKIEEPYILVGAQIGPSGFKLSGDLDFTEKPIIIDVNKDLGTRMTLEKMSLGAEVGAGTNTKAILLVKNEIRLRPSGYDPDLRTVLELSFNLTSLDLTGSCSMTDEWQDPLGISHYIGTKKTDIIVGNTAVELGWKIGAPTPTNLGFAAGRAKFFDIDFGAAMSISPGSGQIALKAYSKRITMKQFENTLRNGFGLNIPDVFPASNNVYVDDANILFAPNGGKIGEFEIEQGFAFKGGLQFAGMMEGSVDFFANLDDGFYFDMYMNAEKMYQLLEREVKKESNPQNRKALEMALDNLQIRKIHLHMEADKSLNMSGAAKAKLRLFGNNVSFDLHGTFSPEKIVDQLIENIGKKALAQVEQVGKEVVKVAGAAANASINTAKAGYDKLGYYAEHSTTWWDHKSHGNSCMTKCVPNRAEKLSGPVYESSNQAIKDFYDKVIPKAAKIEGRYHREKYIKADWDRLTSSIDNNWENIIRDDLYKGFDKDKSDVEKLGKKYRKLVREKKQQHINYRNKIWEKLMTKKPQVEYKYVWSKKMPELLGVTQLIPVETPTDKSFVLAVNSNKGIIDVYKVNADGSISVKVSSKAIKKGTWAVTSYDLYNRNYIFVSHSIYGEAEVYTFDNNGVIGDPIWTEKAWDKGIDNAVALEGGLFIYSSTAGNAWIFKIKGNGSIGEVIWSTTKWATGLNSFTALSNSVLFITKTTGKAWVFKLVNNDFVRLWSTMGYSKGISVTAANYLKNHNSTAHVADPPNGKQWILNHDGAKTVKVAHSQRWPKNISVQALVNQGSYILLLNPLTGEVWSNMVLIKSTFD